MKSKKRQKEVEKTTMKTKKIKKTKGKKVRVVAKSSSANKPLDPETIQEILDYNHGMHLGPPLYYRFDVIPSTNESDIDFWLNEKLQFEGEPPDKLLIETIGLEEEIKRPIILDIDNNHTVEGRHRLFAAKEFGLDVPIVMISGLKQSGFKRMP